MSILASDPMLNSASQAVANMPPDQAIAYLTAHGTDPDEIDEESFSDICVMYSNGVIGNLGILEVLGTLTAGQFNKMLPKTAVPYKLSDIIPQAYDYLYPPLSEQDKKKQVNSSLLAFAASQKGAPSILTKGKHG